MEWLRFAFSALFTIAGVLAFAVGTFGIYRFKFVMNRMHAAAILDTMGLLFVIVGLVIARGFTAVSWKLLLVVVFLWLTSPISSHLLAKMEYFTDADLGGEIKNDLRKIKGDDNDEYRDL